MCLLLSQLYERERVTSFKECVSILYRSLKCLMQVLTSFNRTSSTNLQVCGENNLQKLLDFTNVFQSVSRTTHKLLDRDTRGTNSFISVWLKSTV